MAVDFNTLCWEYFGADAEGTAQHFSEHLYELLEREGIPCKSGTKAGPASALVWCEVDSAHTTKLAQALRPKRIFQNSNPFVTVDE